MNKVLVTGGSGFIGTNLVSFLSQKGYRVLNLDIVEPKKSEHYPFWERVDIREAVPLTEAFTKFQPQFVIHLAARTDLNGKSINDYDSNTIGVTNLLSALEKVKMVERVIFASSMYVCKPGYVPKSFEDYHPHTLYGESKVRTEKLIKDRDPNGYTWCIIRPTSIWGPWFGEPYRDFFKIVLSRRYFHLGTRACTKTYGYVENTIDQISALLNEKKVEINRNVYYLGDYTPYNISEWADEIAGERKIKIYRIPFFFFKMLAIIGDFLKTLGFKFPITSFRLKNMMTNNIQDLEPIKKIAPDLKFNRQKGITNTLAWMFDSDYRNGTNF